MAKGKPSKAKPRKPAAARATLAALALVGIAALAAVLARLWSPLVPNATDFDPDEHPPGCVVRVHRTDASAFAVHRYARAVVVSGITDNSRARRTWTAEFLRNSAAAEAPLNVKQPYPLATSGGGRTASKAAESTLGKYLDLMRAHAEGRGQPTLHYGASRIRGQAAKPSTVGRESAPNHAS